ncbi:hypothetical protein HYFRA_00000033 [Hymenoscyphus fraxineus]|uniref:Uncharacterized protein n=1 Tax=Hymenoscyphus fraxineus TaxID=746836 RepID=A0A9N9PWE9_9HELO|nr:hypothetical protein HYFRA_00000033 [Hymenoscyphus fraxineus]
MYFKSSVVVLAAVAAELVAGHGAVVKAVGDMGGMGTALGIDPNTPRDGSKRNPDQQDSTRFKNAAADACGETLAGGANDPATQIPKMLAANPQMPQVSQGGSLMMTLHQVNGDGAGPYDCMIDSTGTGTQWQKVQVTQNVPGTNSRSKAKATDFPLTVKIPADQTCTGTAGAEANMCLVRCNNAARAGPFGGCVPMQMAGAGNATAGADAPAAAAPAAADKRAVEFVS